MKAGVIALGLLVCVLGFGAGPVSAAETAKEGHVHADDEQKGKFCVICGPEEEIDAKHRGEGVTFEYDGQTYWFCSPGCLEEFKKNPEHYAEAAASEDHDAGHDHGHDHDGHKHK
jgi:YHS domain-containing protein